MEAVVITVTKMKATAVTDLFNNGEPQTRAVCKCKLANVSFLAKGERYTLYLLDFIFDNKYFHRASIIYQHLNILKLARA